MASDFPLEHRRKRSYHELKRVRNMVPDDAVVRFLVCQSQGEDSNPTRGLSDAQNILMHWHLYTQLG